MERMFDPTLCVAISNLCLYFLFFWHLIKFHKGDF